MAEFKGIFGIISSSLPLVGKYSYLLNLYMYIFYFLQQSDLPQQLSWWVFMKEIT